MPASHRGMPDPWVEAAFPTAPGQCLVLDSRTIHCGGGRSPALPASAPWRVVAFATLVDPPRDYQVNEVAMRPPWAAPARPSQPLSDQRPRAQCSARACSNAAGSTPNAACARCGSPLCPLHHSLGELCAGCEDVVDGVASHCHMLWGLTTREGGWQSNFQWPLHPGMLFQGGSAFEG